MTVALLDWNWTGHHPTYFTHFAAAMAEVGIDVVPFGADPEDFGRRLGKLGLDEGAAARIARAGQVSGPAPSRFRPARWRGWFEARRFFGGLGRLLRTWERRNGRKIDLVFFACIYDRQFECFRSAERLFGFPWAGLYLHARSFRMPGSPIPYTGGRPCPEKIFSSPLLRFSAVLDEGVVKPMSEIAGQRTVVVFPDLTSDELPPPDGEGWGLGERISALAKGRPVVSLTGHLQWTKGLAEFTALASREDMKDVFFFLGGEVNWMEIPHERRAWMERAWEQAGNLYAHRQHLPEVTMNTVIAQSDAIFAAYRSFPNSSNVLTKAALFERPVLVSDGHLMAERVRAFALGEVVPEGDVDAMVPALRRMLEPGYRASLKQRAKWEDYRALHSAARLRTVLAQCFGASTPDVVCRVS